jgi:hypothetical protein
LESGLFLYRPKRQKPLSPIRGKIFFDPPELILLLTQIHRFFIFYPLFMRSNSISHLGMRFGYLLNGGEYFPPNKGQYLY